MADPQISDSSSERVLYLLQLFVGEGDVEGVKSLLENLGEDDRHRLLSVPDEISGELPSHSAAKHGQVDVLEAVLPEYEDVNARSTNSGRSALHFAAGYGHSKAVQWLFACRMADLNMCDHTGNTPLHLAVLLGHKDVVRFLVPNEGVSLTALNGDGMMPVSYCKDREMFQALLSSRASSFNARRAMTSPCQLHGPEKIDAADADGRTILHYAAQYSTNREVIAMLIFETTHVEMRDSEGDSFLDVAAKAGNMAVLEALKKLDQARIDKRSLIRGQDELHSPGLYALLHNRREFFDELVSMGKVQITLGCIIKVLIAGLIGNSNIQERLPLFASTLPSYLALYANKDLVFEFLLEKTQLTVNQWDDVHKRTCLHWAVVDKRKDIVEKLCKNVQLRPSIQDGDGKTALQHAFEQKHYEIMEILRGRSDFKDHEEKLYRDRDVYVQALNAILVGAALIASVTFAGWLQLPGDVFKSLGMKVFWASNSLSFYSAVATMCVTIAALIPTPSRYVGDIVHQLRLAIVLDASLLALSLAAVMVAFAAAGFAALRHSHVSEYQASMRATTMVGGSLCTVMWIGFVLQLYRCVPSLKGVLLTLLRFVPKCPESQGASLKIGQGLLARVGDSSRFGYPNVLREDIRNAMSLDLVENLTPADTVPDQTSTPDLSTMRRLLSKLQIPDKESFIQELDPEKRKKLLLSRTLKDKAMSNTIGEFDLPSAI